MREVFEKIMDKLSDLHEMYINQYGVVGSNLGASAVSRCKGVIEEVAEEYNNGWIPCNEDKPKQNGWYECWYMVSAVGENKEYEPITLYWEENIWLYRPNRFTMPTQRNVVAWKPIAPYQSKGE